MKDYKLNNLKSSTKRYTGLALPLVMTAIVLLMVMGAGLFTLGFQSRVYAIRTTSQISARCAADAGLAKAIYEMNQKIQTKPWDDSELPQETNQQLPTGDSTYSYTITGDHASGYTITSTGTAGEISKQVASTLKITGPFEFAVYGIDEVDMKNGGSVDWYNYSPDDEPLKVGTSSTSNDKIELKNSTYINGDVVVGVNGDPGTVIKDAGATITGDTYAAPEEEYIPSVTVPYWLDALPSSGQIKNSTTLTTSGKYSKIDLGNGEILTIDGPVTLYITGKVILDNSAQIQITDPAVNPNASLTIYLADSFEGKNSSSLNNPTNDPKKLKMYGLDSCSDMKFKNSSTFYGVIYAPQTDVEFDNSADAYGAIVAKTFEQKNSADFYYDASLRDANEDDEAVRFEINRWEEN